MTTAQRRELLCLLDALDEAVEEIDFQWWLQETVWGGAVNRWLGKLGEQA